MSETKIPSYDPETMRRIRWFHMSGTVYPVVHRWLSPLSVYEPFMQYGRSQAEAHADLRKIAAAVGEAVGRDARLRQLLDTVAAYVATPIASNSVGGQQRSLYLDSKRPGSTLLRTYVSAAYARGLHVLRGDWFRGLQSAPDIERWITGDWTDGAVTHIQQKLTQLGPHFIGHLLLEAEHRAVQDPDFRNRLDSALQAIEEVMSDDERAAFAGAQGQELELLGGAGARSALGLHTHVAFALTLWD
jgi:hypothetical protein